jgi:hypothetical protein
MGDINKNSFGREGRSQSAVGWAAIVRCGCRSECIGDGFLGVWLRERMEEKQSVEQEVGSRVGSCNGRHLSSSELIFSSLPIYFTFRLKNLEAS